MGCWRTPLRGTPCGGRGVCVLKFLYFFSLWLPFSNFISPLFSSSIIYFSLGNKIPIGGDLNRKNTLLLLRYGFGNPVNYNDNELYCGGFRDDKIKLPTIISLSKCPISMYVLIGKLYIYVHYNTKNLHRLKIKDDIFQ